MGMCVQSIGGIILI